MAKKQDDARCRRAEIMAEVVAAKRGSQEVTLVDRALAEQIEAMLDAYIANTRFNRSTQSYRFQPEPIDEEEESGEA